MWPRSGDDLSHRIKVASSEGDLTGKIREQLGRFTSAETGTGFSLRAGNQRGLCGHFISLSTFLTHGSTRRSTSCA